MSQESEAKTLPASEKKLREARRKGQVSNSRDLVSGFSIFAAMTFLYIAGAGIISRIGDFAELAINAQTARFSEVAGTLLHQAMIMLLWITIPLVGVVVAVIIIGSTVAKGGAIFSAEPLKPKFEHLNPVQGLKRIASARNVIEFAKGLIKTLLLAVVFVAILLVWLQPLFEVPGCGLSCLKPTALSILTMLGSAAALCFIAVGVIDVPIQRWLFLRDMRMTKSEFRREHKDMEGDPQIRQELKRQRRDTLGKPFKLGIANAVLVIAGHDRLVGLRYVSGETPIPAIVCKGEGAVAAKLRAQALELGVPVADDAELADTLFKRIATGDYVKADYFPAIVGHLIRHGLV